MSVSSVGFVQYSQSRGGGSGHAFPPGGAPTLCTLRTHPERGKERPIFVCVVLSVRACLPGSGNSASYNTGLLQYKRGAGVYDGREGAGTNQQGSGGSSRYPPSHPSLPSPATCERLPMVGGVPGGAGLGSSIPPVPPLRGQGARASSLLPNSLPQSPEPASSPAETAPREGRGRRSKCKGSRCWSLSFIFGGGAGQVPEVGASLRSPAGRSVMERGGAGDTDPGARAKEGLGGSERPGLKARHPPQLWALWHPKARPMTRGVGDSRGGGR